MQFVKSRRRAMTRGIPGKRRYSVRAACIAGNISLLTGDRRYFGEMVSVVATAFGCLKAESPEPAQI